MNANYPSRIQRGFTLIELVIVLAVLGALASIAVPQLTGLQEEADLAGTATTISSELGNAFARDLAQGAISGGDVDWNSANCTTGFNSVSAALSSGGYGLAAEGQGDDNAVTVTIPSYNSASNEVSSVTCDLSAP